MASHTLVDPFVGSSRRSSYGRATSSPVIGKSGETVLTEHESKRRSTVRILGSAEDGSPSWHTAEAIPLSDMTGTPPSLGRFESWIGNPVFADVVFLVGTEKTNIPAHRILLAASDSIFKDLIQSDNATTLISALSSSPSSVFSFHDATSASAHQKNSTQSQRSSIYHKSRSHSIASTRRPLPSPTSGPAPPLHIPVAIDTASSSPASSSAPESPTTRRDLFDGMLPIVLEDVKPEIFLKLLSFLYCNKVTLYFDVVADYNVILDLLDISDRFRVPALSNLLINFLETDTNALKIIGPELISQLKTKINPGQPLTPTSLSRQSSVSSTSSATPTGTTDRKKSTDGSAPNNGSGPSGNNLNRKFRPRSGTTHSDESDSLSDRMEDSTDHYDEDTDAIQYNISSRSIQFSDTIKRRIAVAKLRIEEQARKMKADSEEIDWICSKPDLLPARVHHTASSFGNALVLIGGHDGNQNVVGSGVEFLVEPTDKPGSLVWTETRKTGAGPRTLHSHATCRVGNRFYTYGGIVDGERSSKLFIVAVINDETVHWSVPRLTGDLPPALTHHSLLRYDKHLVLFGGFDGKEANSDVWTMDTETNKWTKRSPQGQSATPPSPALTQSGSIAPSSNITPSSSSSAPTARSIAPRFGHCALIVSNKMLVLGGNDHYGNYFNDALAYDLDTGVWSNLVNKTTVPRMAFHSAVRVGRHILVYGGRRKSSGLVKELWKVIWDEASGEILWTKLKCTAAPHERFGHTVNRIGSKIYVVGGCNDRGRPFGDLCEANTVQLPLENNARVIDHSELEISSLVGMGNFSQVRRGIWNNNLIAIKLIKASTSKIDPQAQKSKDKSKSIKDFKSEVELLSQLKHPNLVAFLGYCLEPNAIVMEYLPQNLHDYLIENRGKLESQQLSDFAYDIARGMEYLHRNSIIHRDLKSFNILLDENLNVKIADFGIARVKSNTSTMTTTGTIAWTAPEILRHEAYNEKSDVYSYAIVLWEIVSEGEIPFDSEDFQSPMEAGIAVAMGQLRPPLPHDTDPNWAALIEKCWKEDPAARPSFTEIMEQIKKFE